MQKKRFLLVARYYSIEPVGILYLAGLIRDAGWECNVHLVREADFDPLYEEVRSWKPDLVGFQIWTGYHVPAFRACDEVRRLGVPVVIGGPHATYFDTECAQHADWVVKASGFSVLRGILDGTIPHGIHFDQSGREERFPLPDRDQVYERYPELGNSPIKSIFGSVGCPFECTYCYAPTFNDMHGGFRLTARPVDDIVAEAKDIVRNWPLALVYFQDDIFGFNIRWLEEFARKWKSEVGVPFHCQIRLELTQHKSGNRRLDLFRDAGCSGITLAIESGNDFLRDHVLFRHMPHELIVEGCRKITDRGMTLRTEQILAVPFSTAETDIATLALNAEINPTMAWTSILAPYAGTEMGAIASRFGFYEGNNDDLAESFFDRSVLRHVEGGPRDIRAVVETLGAGPRDHALLRLNAVETNDCAADVVTDEGEIVGSLTYLTKEANDAYCQDVVRLQRLFNFLCKVPHAEPLARTILALTPEEFTWQGFGEVVERHLFALYETKLHHWARALAHELGYASIDEAPPLIATNPFYFCFFEAGAELARKVAGLPFDVQAPAGPLLDQVGTLTRRHLFEYGLYKIKVGSVPIASR